jgi:hypothetical protein
MEQYTTELQYSKDLGIEVEKEAVEITPEGIKTPAKKKEEKEQD